MFIADIGINHNGNIKVAESIIKQLSLLNKDIVIKFQKRTPEICVPKDQWEIVKDTPFGEMSYIEYKKKIEFGKDEYDKIDKLCKELGVKWTASVWDIPSLDFIMQYDVPFIKVASASLTDLELINAIKETGKTVIMSTGGSTIEQIETAVNIVKPNLKCLMHCVSEYPTHDFDANLNVMHTLREKFDVPIGYSGHEIGFEPTLLSFAMGAYALERHVTLNKKTKGTDHKLSLDMRDMHMLFEKMSFLEKIKGSKEKTITTKEQENMKKLRG